MALSGLWVSLRRSWGSKGGGEELVGCVEGSSERILQGTVGDESEGEWIFSGGILSQSAPWVQCKVWDQFSSVMSGSNEEERLVLLGSATEMARTPFLQWIGQWVAGICGPWIGRW